MIKKIILASLLAVLLLAVIYLGFIKKGFVYFTGISTPYSYFQARNDRNNKTLTFYEQDLIQSVAYINLDSIQLHYGFKTEFGGWDVSYSVMKLYNSVIFDELMQRLGEKKWNECQWKVDSLSTIAIKNFESGLNSEKRDSTSNK
jgi:hypothetical protein